MLNQIALMGRLTRTPETRFLQNSNNSVTQFSIAVERDYKSAGEEKPKSDFISCTAWNKVGEFVAKHFDRGNMISVIGSLETDSYTNAAGNKVYITYVRVGKAYFTGEKTGVNNELPQVNEPSADEFRPTTPEDFMRIPDGVEDEGLPFNQ